jgi:hypothetical protein
VIGPEDIAGAIDEIEMLLAHCRQSRPQSGAAVGWIKQPSSGMNRACVH